VVIVCQKCHTRFQLDDAKLPAKGARVRCSRCKHAFFVAPAPASDATVSGLAEGIAPPRVASAPRASADLPDPSTSAPDLSSALAAASAGEEEADWQFNLDPPARDSGMPVEAQRVEAPAPAPAHREEHREDEGPASYFDVDGLRDPDRRAAATAAGEEEAVAAPASTPERRRASQGALSRPVGKVEEWGFPSEDEAETEPPAPAVAPQRARAREGPEGSLDAAVRSAPAREPAAAAPSAGARAREALRALPWVAVVALFAFGLYGAWRPPADAATAAAPQAVGALELAGLRVRRIENFYAGPVVVLDGELHNPGAAAAQSGGAARVRVTDAAGGAIEAVAPAFLGRALSDRELRERDPRDLASDLERSGRELAVRTLAPDERVRVQAVLADLPPSAATVRFEVDRP
jgi:predicted Zn finger-like uncharacterized protein